MRLVPALLALGLSLPLAAQHEHADQPSPYGDLTTRRIKALSDEDITRLRNGEGMGFALAAELNHYPGPRHVLDLADHLGLTAEQRARIEAVRVRMAERARALGAELIAAEEALDRAFAERSITPESLAAGTARIGELTAALRATHLGAHLDVTAVLSAEQVRMYDEVRGYAGK